MNKPAANYSLPLGLRISLVFTALALVCALMADLSINTRTPWQEVLRFTQGFISPTWLPLDTLLAALFKTLAFAVLAVSLAAGLGFIFSFFFHHRTVRALCASTRAVHELFWGLLFIQVFGLHPLVGILAIAIPYSGVFAKVFSEIIEERAQNNEQSLAPNCDRISRFFYTQWPRVKDQFSSYFLYRIECGLRSSTVLGFIGLPTLGFHLESGFMQGDYPTVASLLIIFYTLIASMRYWAKLQLLPIFLVAALWYLWEPVSANFALVATLLNDTLPLPIRTGQGDLWLWLSALGRQQIAPGIWNTLLVTQIVLVCTGLFALGAFPFLSNLFVNAPTRAGAHLLMVILRSTPEFILAFLFLMFWGPSHLPAIAALTLHNGAIVAHLIARHSQSIELRRDASRGSNRYFYECLPRIYGQFLAFLCYRWEVIMRETAIVGILGIHTLGFFIDSAFESFRLDVALILIIISALMNIASDALARRVRRQLHLNATPTWSSS